MNFERKHLRNKSSEAFVSHFRLLGLNRGECRSDIIRSAAQAMSAALTNAEHHAQGTYADGRRALIALAAYRLLDPRERKNLYERVQLSYPIDRDDIEIARVTHGQLVNQMTPVPPKAMPKTSSKVKLMKQPVIDRAIEPAHDESGSKEDEGSSPESDTHPIRDLPNVNQPLVALPSADTDLSLDERRNLVRQLRQADESNTRGLSPLGWIRSRLGI